MDYLSPARCSLLRPTPFHGSVWSHYPCIIDVSQTIDIVAIFPPFADISILRVPIDRTIVQCQSIAYRGAPFPGSWWFWNFYGSVSFAFPSHLFISRPSLVLCWQHLTPHWQLLRAGA